MQTSVVTIQKRSKFHSQVGCLHPHVAKCSIRHQTSHAQTHKARRHTGLYLALFMVSSSGSCTERPGQIHQRALQIRAASFISSLHERLFHTHRLSSSLTTTARFCLTAPSMPGLTVVGACELGQDAERAGLGGASARLPVLSVLDQPFLAMVIGDEARKVLHPKAVSAHTPESSIRQVWVNTTLPTESLMQTPANPTSLK